MACPFSRMSVSPSCFPLIFPIPSTHTPFPPRLHLLLFFFFFAFPTFLYLFPCSIQGTNMVMRNIQMNCIHSWDPTKALEYYFIQCSLSLVLFLHCNINRSCSFLSAHTHTHKHSQTHAIPSTRLHEWFRSMHIDYLPPALGSAQAHLAAAGPAC